MRALIAPRFLDIHRITESHEHIGMIYWARAKNGSLQLSTDEHHDIGWFSAEDLDKLKPSMSKVVINARPPKRRWRSSASEHTSNAE